ncbi:hypothetical protein QCB44_08285 [Thiomicrorhabdus sp. zzn3]|uniref:hypothetical protein n=1 Tax=Thiomicrorhabdus sp. zzn3 TaxID=3039775 RepID=UPI00243645E4|nr:hypothetical protein [Thiomicrorhabdus sp. zzn3]MDG6778699.1 hypothetical protein [Thiomicrorhabdus sp. zzn3]
MDKTAPSAKEYLLQDLDSGLIYEGLQKMENFQVWLGGHVQETSELIDDYFGTQESFEYARGSRLDVMTPVIFHDSGQVEMSLRMRAKLAFPKIAKRWHLLITSEDTSVKGQVNSDLARDVTEEEGTASLGFQVMLEEYDKLATLLDFGLNFQNIIDPDPYVRLKKRYEWQLKNDWTSRMSQNLFWERVAGPGLESKLVFDHELDEVYLFRSQTDGVWWHDDGYYDLIERFLLYQRVNPHRLLTYQLRFDWDTQGPGFHNTDYGVAVNWREKAYKNWLYFEIEPGVRFTEENDFAQADLTLMLMLEMRFYSRI